MSRSRKKKKQSRAIPAAGMNPAIAKQPDAGEKSLARLAAPVTAIALALVGGVVYGLQTDRWFASTAVTDAAAKLDGIPIRFGDWEGTNQEVSAAEIQQAEVVGHVARVYRNRVTGDAVNVMLLCGKPGPISLHPPTVCFTSAGWLLTGGLKKQPSANSKGESTNDFWVTTFQKTTPIQTTRKRTFWAWNNAGKWIASDDPRFEFAGSEHLYKLYVTAILPPFLDTKENPEAENEVCLRFLRVFLDELNKAGI